MRMTKMANGENRVQTPLGHYRFPRPRHPLVRRTLSTLMGLLRRAEQLCFDYAHRTPEDSGEEAHSNVNKSTEYTLSRKRQR